MYFIIITYERPDIFEHETVGWYICANFLSDVLRDMNILTDIVILTNAVVLWNVNTSIDIGKLKTIDLIT